MKIRKQFLQNYQNLNSDIFNKGIDKRVYVRFLPVRAVPMYDTKFRRKY